MIFSHFKSERQRYSIFLIATAQEVGNQSTGDPCRNLFHTTVSNRALPFGRWWQEVSSCQLSSPCYRTGYSQ
ncbi:hypothetical protein FBUS_00786 [Fasciolopsis buskii]|uniref:Uncharacterized protein n=1 Tax=Fasciolopsis buskii TaxID=27845 RepID=A0A8E0S6H8_9TREM|nr:hypothetical protein FBUS_00786 [Fasciolopsis buski]